jgi:hypothetical protein
MYIELFENFLRSEILRSKALTLVELVKCFALEQKFRNVFSEIFLEFFQKMHSEFFNQGQNRNIEGEKRVAGERKFHEI